MKGSFARALVAAALAAAVFAGTALAANVRSFFDASSDSSSAPDIVAVAISNDDNGNVTIKITLRNRVVLGTSDAVQVGLDTDQNPDSGMVFYGTEYELLDVGGAAKFYRAAADGLDEEAPLPASFRASFSGDAVTMTFKASDLGISSGFNVYVISYDDAAYDAAPDIRATNYQLSGGTTPPPLAPDRRPPLDVAVKSRGIHGKTALLYYVAADGRGETADTIVVYKRKKVVKRIHSLLQDTSPLLEYAARWNVPKKTRGNLRFCVSSTDRAGNKSNTSCAALTIK